MDAPKSVFVTVGTTSFNELISSVCTSSICEILKNQGYTKLVLQVGNGNIEPVLPEGCGLTLEWFKFKENISKDIEKADLILSHAGAGSILESLKAQKSLIVVINEKLMGNHQTELAEQLQEEEYLLCCTCNNLKETLIQRDQTAFRSYPTSDLLLFPSFLDRIVGFM